MDQESDGAFQRHLSRPRARACELWSRIRRRARFRVSEGGAENAGAELVRILPELEKLPRITGAHLCRADSEASGTKTAESRDRTDIQAPPNWFALIEACTPDALDEPVRRVIAIPGIEGIQLGRYMHEYTRLKTDWAAG
jgi:hypothetical protein